MAHETRKRKKRATSDSNSPKKTKAEAGAAGSANENLKPLPDEAVDRTPAVPVVEEARSRPKRNTRAQSSGSPPPPVYKEFSDTSDFSSGDNHAKKQKPAKSTPRRPARPSKKQTLPPTRKGRAYPKIGDPYSDYVALENGPSFTHLQKWACQRYRNAIPHHCEACISKQAKTGTCRFQNIRKFEVEYPNRTTKVPPPQEGGYCLVGDQQPLCPENGQDETVATGQELAASVAPYANTILPLIVPNLITRLRREKSHESIHSGGHHDEELFGGPRPMIRLERIVLKSLCDICATSNFMGAYMAGCCGRELCLACWEEWKPVLAGEDPVRLDQCSRGRLHRVEAFYFTTRAYPGEIDWMLGKMESCVREHQQNTLTLAPVASEIPVTLPVHPHPDGPAYLPTPTDSVSNVSLEQFQDLLRRGGVPLVITGLEGRFKLPWTAEFFVENHGDQGCQITNCADGEVTFSTVGKFFAKFSEVDGVKSWKLKDWPPNSDFNLEFPELFNDFEGALPFPSYTARDAPFNLASRFPEDWIRPDLGPKMYNAYPAPDFIPSRPECPNPIKGTTNIHFDMTDAVNIMVHATGGPEEAEAQKHLEEHGYPDCGAIWDIFPPESSDNIRKYLKTQNKQVDDPLNRPLFYLTEGDLAELGKPENGTVRSFRIYQNTGDAVFIPAGCPHQVRNRRSCVKVAVDFFSAENAKICTDLLEDFRNLAHATVNRRSLVGRREDVLQPWNCMLFNWKRLTGLEYVDAVRSGHVVVPGTDAPMGQDQEVELTVEEGKAGGGDGGLVPAADTRPLADDDTGDPMEVDEKAQPIEDLQNRTDTHEAVATGTIELGRGEGAEGLMREVKATQQTTCETQEAPRTIQEAIVVKPLASKSEDSVSTVNPSSPKNPEPVAESKMENAPEGNPKPV